MILTAENLTKDLSKQWPGLTNVFPMDMQFWCPTYEQLQIALVQIGYVKNLIVLALHKQGISFGNEYLSELHDCDNFALELQADVSRYRLNVAKKKNIPVKELLPWAFGTVLCSMVQGQAVNHAINICDTRDRGFVFIEPQNFSSWVGNKDMDIPYFIEMR